MPKSPADSGLLPSRGRFEPLSREHSAPREGPPSDRVPPPICNSTAHYQELLQAPRGKEQRPFAGSPSSSPCLLARSCLRQGTHSVSVEALADIDPSADW